MSRMTGIPRMTGSSPDPGSALSPADLDGWEPLLEYEAGTLVKPLLETGESFDAEDLAGKRQFPRLVAPPCRPVMVRMRNPTDDQASTWFYGDILDISHGGLCLLITESQLLEVGEHMSVDFKLHRLPPLWPSSDSCLEASVRWFVRSGHVTTMGLGFGTSLVDLPELLPERRQRLRDPNTPSEPPQSKK
jgi:hypothetical protein